MGASTYQLGILWLLPSNHLSVAFLANCLEGKWCTNVQQSLGHLEDEES